MSIDKLTNLHSLHLLLYSFYLSLLCFRLCLVSHIGLTDYSLFLNYRRRERRKVACCNCNFNVNSVLLCKPVDRKYVQRDLALDQSSAHLADSNDLCNVDESHQRSFWVPPLVSIIILTFYSIMIVTMILSVSTYEISVDWRYTNGTLGCCLAMYLILNTVKFGLLPLTVYECCLGSWIIHAFSSELFSQNIKQ